MQAILKEGYIPNEAYQELVECEIGEKLLEKNVFAYHFCSKRITFQPTLMKRFCEQKIAHWSKKLRDTEVP
jgi:hypothetical protein